jgi:AraC family transcriptional regulator, arabinose operon regulatory protein
MEERPENIDFRLMLPCAETPSPPVGSILTGYWNIRGRVHGWRPKGTRDWLLIYTESGCGVIRSGEKEYHVKAGDIIHYRPGAPQDYGQHDPAGRWKHIWIHWLPRVEFFEGPAWPELFPGVGHLRLAPSCRSVVRRELALADAVMRTDSAHRKLMAGNAVERAILYCGCAIPGRRVEPWHPGIRKAVEFMATHLHEEITLGQLARRSGCSRSGFAALFREQTGQPPMRYLESLRLAQARQMLEYTSQTLAQIAEHVGFTCPFYLSRRFKKSFGLSPRAYRNQK